MKREARLEGTRLSVSLRIAKTSGDPVVVVPEATSGDMTLAIWKVDKLALYNLVAQALRISAPSRGIVSLP